MAPYLLASDSVNVSTSTIPKALCIVGFTIAGLCVAASVSWFTFRHFRHRSQKNHVKEPGSVVREKNESVNHTLSAQPTNIIFPQRAVVPPKTVTPSRHDDTPSSQLHHPSPSPRPRPRALSGLNPAHPRYSRASTSHSPTFFRGLNSRNSLSSSSSFQVRSVRQLFQPVLHDELTLSRVGDHFTVLQSFDDGWCLVARDNSRNSRSSLSIFNLSRLSSRVETDGEYAEVGFVPAWVFAKPLKGVRVERPIRSSSAGPPQAGDNTRDSGISWANFGT